MVPMSTQKARSAGNPEFSPTLNGMANDRDTLLQAILGRAIDLWLRENADRFGER